MNLTDNIKRLKQGLLLMACAGLAACSSDSLQEEPGGGNISGDASYYVAINLNIPKPLTSRSTTNDDGTSIDGWTADLTQEEKIDNISLYFFNNSEGTDKGTQLLTISFGSGEVSGAANSGTDNRVSTTYTLKKEIGVDEMKALFGKKIHLYAIANIPANSNVLTIPTDASKTAEENFQSCTISGSSFFRSVVTNSENGMVCPMANADYKEINLEGYSLSANPTVEEVIGAFQQLINYNIDCTYHLGALDLERMVARVDYKGASLTVGSTEVKNLYKLANHTSSVADCNTTDGGVYLKVNNMTLFNIAQSAYGFRHTAKGSTTSADKAKVKPFGVENASTDTDLYPTEGDDVIENPYSWVASNNWDTTNYFTNAFSDTGITATSGKQTADEITAVRVEGYTNAGYSPWYYIMEHTVSSTENMDLEHCTGIEFEVVLYKNTGEVYTTDEENAELRITCNKEGDDKGKYKVLSAKADGNGKYYYALTYRIVIPHNIGNGSGTPDGETGVTTSKLPMQYGVVRNNAYQLYLNGINSLPNPNEPDNMYLSLEVKVLSWARRDIDVSF